ncbi:MAG: ABC transporter ATP-binding protein [Cytophagales bacterium]|nr:ABC transporter ATP-binding protein [Bernardetiaceae bacterium]MDW8204834.1 ABC transporter ATP-binding protein [Cytophagales bacterium]
MPIIQTIGISKVFNIGASNEFTALTNISLTIEAGECVLLSGPSGSGKSTLLSILACLAKPTEGAYFCMGEQVSRWSEKFLTRFRRQHIGMIFQQFHLIRGLNVRANIAIPLVPQGLSHSRLKAAVEQAAEQTGIAHKLDIPVEKLSGGEQQRVAIARAIVAQPAILFADEPTAHLDSHNAKTILDLFANFQKNGKTIIIASHDPLVQQHFFISKRLIIRDGMLAEYSFKI